MPLLQQRLYHIVVLSTACNLSTRSSLDLTEFDSGGTHWLHTGMIQCTHWPAHGTTQPIFVKPPSSYRPPPPFTLKTPPFPPPIALLLFVQTHGGVFAYPADVRNPNGKLRLLYEGNPIAMIVEQAGGVATTGFEAIRDVRPQSVHHRIPAFFGSPDDLLPLLAPRYLHSRTGTGRR